MIDCPAYCVRCGNGDFHWHKIAWNCCWCKPYEVPCVRYAAGSREPIYTGRREVYRMAASFFSDRETLAMWPADFTPPFPVGAAVGALKLRGRTGVRVTGGKA